MNCAHVLGLIDAGPLADYPAAELAAAWRHARACATCGPALEAATALTAGLAALPQAAPPATLTAAVLARIARIDEARDVPAVASRADAHAAPASRHWWAPAAALGGLAAGVALVLSNAWASTDFMSLRSGATTAALVSMPPTPSLALVLAAGVVLYAAGLFAPAGGGRRA